MSCLRTSLLLACSALGSSASGPPPVFRLGTYGLMNGSAHNYWMYHVVPYAAKIALEKGLLKEAVPNWQDFSVDILHYPTPGPLYPDCQCWCQCYAEDATAILPEMLGANINNYRT